VLAAALERQRDNMLKVIERSFPARTRVARPNGGYRNYIRLNYGHPWTCEIERGVETVGALSRSLS
jgi:DNA-binding transcriptional MocR family regulator